jgi:CheY-like chemotaxis protein
MSSQTIVVIEDNAGHFRIMEKTFTRLGVPNPLVRLEDGQAGVDYLLRQGVYADQPLPAILILIIDLNLPKLMGAEVLKRITPHEHLNQIPRIIMTTSDEPEDIEECRKYGFNEYFVKPPDYLRLAAYIQRLNEKAAEAVSSSTPPAAASEPVKPEPPAAVSEPAKPEPPVAVSEPAKPEAPTTTPAVESPPPATPTVEPPPPAAPAAEPPPA